MAPSGSNGGCLVGNNSVEEPRVGRSGPEERSRLESLSQLAKPRRKGGFGSRTKVKLWVCHWPAG